MFFYQFEFRCDEILGVFSFTFGLEFYFLRLKESFELHTYNLYPINGSLGFNLQVIDPFACTLVAVEYVWGILHLTIYSFIGS